MTEWEGCEKPVVEALIERGWEYVPGAELPRGEDEIIVKDYLREFVAREAEKIGVEMKDELFNHILLALTGRPGMEGYRESLTLLKEGKVAVDVKGRGLVGIKIIDYENIGENNLVVSNQVRYVTAEGMEKRLDVVLFVNGIPIVAIECKNPAGTQNWYDAFLQLRGYERSLPELFRFVQINVAIGAKARAYPTMPWREGTIRMVKWGVGEFDEMQGMVDLLSPDTLLDVLRNFVFIYQHRGGYYKLMPRFIQYRAANEIYEAALKRKEGGVIWHWQGSGKTFTMIFAAYKLYTEERMEKPTVFFVMDRKELQGQFFEFLRGMDFGGKVNVEKIESVEHLDRTLRFDSGRGKRGFFVLLIQKFRERGGIDIEEIEKLGGSERENILVFVDEAHRTQYGILAARMKRSLKKAKFFAFTGTPLLRSDKNTFREFGVILDRYFIRESVEDGYTVPIIYTFSKERGITLNREELKRAVDEIMPDGSEEEIAKRLRPTREFMKSEKRVKKIAKNVVEDLLTRRYKGMLVAVDREACVLYRNEILRHIKKKHPDLYRKYGERFVEIVMTYNPGKEKVATVEEYRIAVEKRYGMPWDEVNKKLREDFRDEEKMPRLIIVTDMLLTGYDVPVLEVMYLDKIMNGHNLLQAIARTNRPYEEKGYGIVVDFVGIFKIFRETLRKYYAVDDIDVENAAISVDILRDKLEEKLERLCGKFPEICEDMESLASTDRDALYAALYSIYQSGKEKDLERTFREINRIWCALGGDPVKAENKILIEFRAIYAVYLLHRRLNGKPVPGDVIFAVKEISDSIRKMSGLRGVGHGWEVVINEEFLRNVEMGASSHQSVVDMTAILNSFVASVRGNPVNEKIFGDVIEYIERAIERWKDRKSTIEELYIEEKKALEKIISENEKLKKFRISTGEYALIKLLEKELGENEEIPSMAIHMVNNLKDKNLLFKGWYRKSDVVKEIREIIRIKILKYMVNQGTYNSEKLDRIIDEIMNLMPYVVV